MDPQTQQEIDALRHAGRFEEAAERALQDDAPRQAAELYASAWQWTRARTVAEEAGLLSLAYRYAIEEGPGERAALLVRLEGDARQAEEAILYAEQRKLSGDAGRLLESLGRLEEASARYEGAGQLMDAARCASQHGDARTAGRLYERRLGENPGDGEAALNLGRILLQFGRYEPAARALQQAAKAPAQAPVALPLLVAAFDALGMAQAAASALARLQREEEAPSSANHQSDVAGFLEAHFGDARGFRAPSTEVDGQGRLLGGRYRIDRSLGSGGSGRVLLAEDLFYRRPVAIKVLHVAAGARGRDLYTRFVQEARVAASIDDDQVVRIFDFDDAGPFLVMEYMAGGTLEERLAQGALPPSVCHAVSRAVLQGLSAVHRRGVVHRDLKPANVFFGAAGDVKIGDFGVAHLQDLNRTMTGAMMGTLAYMAPEQLHGEIHPHAATDLYAFGVMLFRMLSGHLPFEGQDLLDASMVRTPPNLSDRTPHFGDTYDALLHDLLAEAMDARPESADDVIGLLDALSWEDPADGIPIAPGNSAATDEPSETSLPAIDPNARYVHPSAAPADALDGVRGPPPPRGTLGLSGGRLRWDRWLTRMVCIAPCPPPLRDSLRHFTQATHPGLQAVYALDETDGEVHVEPPPPSDRAPRAEDLASLLDALASLHEAGVSYGPLDADAFRFTQPRAFLLLPPLMSSQDAPSDEGMAQERATLSSLVEEALRTYGQPPSE